MMSIISHIVHIAATCTSLGGLFYSRMVLLPNLQYISAHDREVYLSKMIGRFSIIKWSGVIAVTVTGLYQWFDIYPSVENQSAYLAAFALKMLGAFGLFSITFLLALPNQKLDKMRFKRSFWSALNIVCGVVIIAGAVLMKLIRTNGI